MRQLQNDLEKIGSFYQNHRSNIPPDSAFTYGLINIAVRPTARPAKARNIPTAMRSSSISMPG